MMAIDEVKTLWSTGDEWLPVSPDLARRYEAELQLLARNGGDDAIPESRRIVTLPNGCKARTFPLMFRSARLVEAL
jgi:hypothetical protein